MVRFWYRAFRVWGGFQNWTHAGLHINQCQNNSGCPDTTDPNNFILSYWTIKQLTFHGKCQYPCPFRRCVTSKFHARDLSVITHQQLMFAFFPQKILFSTYSINLFILEISVDYMCYGLKISVCETSAIQYYIIV